MTKRWKNILGWTIYALTGAVLFGLIGISDNMGFWFGVAVSGLVDAVVLLLGTACWLVMQ
jgi:hypothetical protein